MYIAPNGKIGCSGLDKFRSVQTTGNHFKVALQKTALLELKIVIGNGMQDYVVGHSVFVRGDVITLHWAKEEFVIEGLPPFILVPIDAVQLVKDNG